MVVCNILVIIKTEVEPYMSVKIWNTNLNEPKLIHVEECSQLYVGNSDAVAQKK